MPDTSEIRRRLAELSAMGGKAALAGVKIAEAAAGRRAVVQSRIDDLRPKALTDAAAAAEYQTLIEERGRLDQVIGRSRAE